MLFQEANVEDDLFPERGEIVYSEGENSKNLVLFVTDDKVSKITFFFPEPYQPPSIPPLGGPRCHRRPEIQSRRHGGL